MKTKVKFAQSSQGSRTSSTEYYSWSIKVLNIEFGWPQFFCCTFTEEE